MNRPYDVLEAGISKAGTIGPYQIVSRLGGGGMGVIYRAVHAGNGQTAAVKTVRFPRRSSLSSIRVEIHTLSRLDHRGVVRILDQGLWEGLPWYAMELLEGDTLRSWIDATWPESGSSPEGGAGRAMFETEADTAEQETTAPAAAPRESPAVGARPRAANGRLDEMLEIFGKLCGPLSFIHGEGVVHRDLKPGNIFIRDDGSPVLMDFGLASLFRGAVGRETLEIGGEPMGTMPYMAPEQVRAELVDARADLYALGCMLYQGLTGWLPFSARTAQATAAKHLYQWALPPSDLVDGVPPNLDRLVLALLEKSPSNRIGHADDVAEILFELAGREGDLHRTGHPGDEGAAGPARVSGYLYRPALVGRAQALETIDQAAAGAAAGTGAFVLVVGESGVGKTFLAAEAGRRAQLRGMRAVTGDALAITPTESGAGTGGSAVAVKGPPFQLFRRLLQTVADVCRESADEAVFERLLGERASILAPFEPTLSSLPGQAQSPPLAEIPGDATLRRAIGALMDLLESFARERPLCLIVDDLQWADDLSLALLAALPVGWLADKSILLVATCRSEEMSDAARALAARPDARQLLLPMLDQEAVASLVAGMLGMKAPPPAMVAFLARQTEGNPFFVAEYLRAAVGERLLFRERGQWRVAAPDGDQRPAFDALALPGSLQELVERRLNGLSADALNLARAAAVLGREVDAAFLDAVAHLDEPNLLDARRQLCARHVLEETDDGRLRFIHDKMREITYARISPDELRRRHHESGRALEEQFRGTPDLQLLYAELAHHFTRGGDTRRAIEYLDKAGRQALANSANREAIRCFGAALALDSDPAVPGGAIRRATWERQIGEAWFALTSLDESREHLLQALDHLDLTFPRSNLRLGVGVLEQLLRQAAHRLWPSRFVGTAGADAETLAEGARACESLLQIFYMASRPGPILYGALRLLNLCELAGPSAALARAYAGIFGTAGVMGLHALARSYLAHATELLGAIADPASESWVYQLATFYWMGVGAWDEAETAGRRAAAAALTVGNRRRWEESQLGLGLTQLLRGRCRPAQETFEGLRDSGMKGNHNAEQHAWILLAQTHVRLGELAPARQALQRAAAIVPSQLDRTVLAQLHATEALTALRLGDSAAARAAADRAAKALWSLPPVMNMLIPHLASLCEVYLSLWAQEAGAIGTGAALRRAARRSCSSLRRFVRVFPIVAPIVGMHEGRWAWLAKKPKRAIRHWQDARAAARRLAMPYEEAQAELALGQHGPGEMSQRRAQITRARELLAELGIEPERTGPEAGR